MRSEDISADTCSYRSFKDGHLSDGQSGGYHEYCDRKAMNTFAVKQTVTVVYWRQLMLNTSA